MGVVLNRRSDATVGDAVPPLAALVGADELIFLGGPVQPEAVVVLADFEEPERARELVFDRVGFLPGELDDAAALGELHAVSVRGIRGLGPGAAGGRAPGGILAGLLAPALRRLHGAARELWATSFVGKEESTPS